MATPDTTEDTASALDRCVQRCLAGDMAAYEELVRIAEPKVRAVLSVMCPDRDRVPDLTQETFIVAWRKLAGYQQGTNFMAWIKAIARNLAQNERRRWFNREHEQIDYQAQVEWQIAESIDQFVEELPEETIESLRNCVGKLGGRTRALVESHYFEGCPVKTLSDMFKLSATAAKVALHRGRLALGKCMKGTDSP